MGTLEGIIIRSTKNGNVGSTLFIGGQAMTDYDLKADYRCEGYRVQQVYVSKIVDAKVGDKIELVWDSGFGGKAYVRDVQVIKK